MRVVLTIAFAFTISAYVSAQEKSVPENGLINQDTSRTEYQRSSSVKKEFDVTNTMFLSNTKPADLPKKEDYKDNELYFKVIQGYINTHSELFNQVEVEKIGFTYPVILSPGKSEQKNTSEKFKRTTPVSEDEKELKRSKEAQIKN